MKHIFYIFTLVFILILKAVDARAQANATDKLVTLKDLSVSMYPIPTSGFLYIKFNKPISVQPVFFLYDMIGNPLGDIDVERDNLSTFRINLNNNPPGFYILRVFIGGLTLARRITLES